MAGITTRFEVLPPLEEWHLNLEVGSQVYELLGGFKHLQKTTLWPDTTSLLHRGGFQNRVRENTPPGCYSSTSGKRVFSTPVHDLHLGEYECNNLSPYILSFTQGGDRFWCPTTEIVFTACQLKLKVNLPLVELEAAKVDLNRFLEERLHELGSEPQVQEELGEITQQLLGYNRRVAEIVQEISGVE